MNKNKQLPAAIAVLMTLVPTYLPAADTATGPDFAINRNNAPVLEKNYSRRI